MSVPGAAAGLPAPAPMLSVPIEPAFVAIVTGPATTPPSAIVSVPVPRLPMFTPELLLQVEPAPVTVTVPCEPAPLPMLAVKAVLLMTVPPFAIVSVPVPKLPILSPPPGPLFQMEPGPVTVTVPFEPAANPTEPPPPLFTVPPSWMVSVPVPRPPTTTVPAFVQLEPAPVTVTVPSPPGRLPINPARIGHRTAVLDGKRARARTADFEVSHIRPRGRRAGYIHRALRTRRTANKPGGRLEYSQPPGAYGHHPAAAGG